MKLTTQDTFGAVLEPQVILSSIPQYLQTARLLNFGRLLHIWAISTTETALTAHLVIPREGSSQFFTTTSEALYTHFKIDHSTLQIETRHLEYSCHLEPEGHV